MINLKKESENVKHVKLAYDQFEDKEALNKAGIKFDHANIFKDKLSKIREKLEALKQLQIKI